MGLEGDMPISVKDAEKAYKGIPDKVRNKANSRGLFMPERPSRGDCQFLNSDGVPVIPRRLLDLSSKDIGELLSVVEEFSGFVRGELAQARNARDSTREMKKIVEAKISIGATGSNKERRDAQKTQDARFVKANEDAMEADAFYQMVSVLNDVWDLKFKTVSRAVSIRQEAQSQGGRGVSVTAGRSRFGNRSDKEIYEDKGDGEVINSPEKSKQTTAPKRRRRFKSRSTK